MGEDGAGSKTEMDEEVCWISYIKKLLDLTTYKLNSDGSITERLAGNINPQSLDRFGLLDPWARNALEEKFDEEPPATGSRAAGPSKTIASSSGSTPTMTAMSTRRTMPPPKGVKVRAAAIVWSRGPDGKDDFESNGGRYSDDDRLSWPYGKSLNN